jgi:hypothetical protein
MSEPEVSDDRHARAVLHRTRHARRIDNPQSLVVRTRVGGEMTSHYTSATGTPSGVGGSRTPKLFLHAGDLVDVDVEIEGVGTLRNPSAA